MLRTFVCTRPASRPVTPVLAGAWVRSSQITLPPIRTLVCAHPVPTPATPAPRGVWPRQYATNLPPLSLARNPDEAIRITNVMSVFGGRYPADRIRHQLRVSSVYENRKTAQKWADALRLICSKDMRHTSRRVLQDEYEHASMCAYPMLEMEPASVYRLGILLDVAPNVLINYTAALVEAEYV